MDVLYGRAVNQRVRVCLSAQQQIGAQFSLTTEACSEPQINFIIFPSNYAASAAPSPLSAPPSSQLWALAWLHGRDVGETAACPPQETSAARLV